MGNLITFDVIKTMIPGEFEDFREGGNDLRRALNHAVRKEIEVPTDWRINCEYYGELGGIFPVQFRFTPPEGTYHICLCSPGALSPVWLVSVLSSSGEFMRIVSTLPKFDPGWFNALLKQACVLNAQGVPPVSMATILSEMAD